MRGSRPKRRFFRHPAVGGRRQPHAGLGLDLDDDRARAAGAVARDLDARLLIEVVQCENMIAAARRRRLGFRRLLRGSGGLRWLRRRLRRRLIRLDPRHGVGTPAKTPAERIARRQGQRPRASHRQHPAKNHPRPPRIGRLGLFGRLARVLPEGPMQFVVVHLAAVSPFEPRAPKLARSAAPLWRFGPRSSRAEVLAGDYKAARFLVAPEKLAYFLHVRSFGAGNVQLYHRDG